MLDLTDLVEGHVPADPHQDVHQWLLGRGAVNGWAEGLDEPGAGLWGPEAVVIPERGLGENSNKMCVYIYISLQPRIVEQDWETISNSADVRGGFKILLQSLLAALVFW